MIYKSIIFSFDPFSDEFAELLIAMLDGYGYEGVFQEENRVTAYIPQNQFNNDELQGIAKMLRNSSCKLSWRAEDIPEQNWNAVWESNFEPVLIDKRCVIRAPFHPDFPGCKYQITIEPKMSFGTGHHHTTRMIMEHMLDIDFSGKAILDMGCGTGVLAILAAMLGGTKITAIDYDSWAYENTIENVARNTSVPIQVIQGSSDTIPQEKYDMILANINRNILIEQMPDYASHSNPGSLLFLSGIMLPDISIVQKAAENEGYSLLSQHQSDQWALLILEMLS